MSGLEQLTRRQKLVYEFIRDKIVNRGYGPTVREIGERFSISSPNGVMCHLKALEKNLAAYEGKHGEIRTAEQEFSDDRPIGFAP